MSGLSDKSFFLVATLNEGGFLFAYLLFSEGKEGTLDLCYSFFNTLYWHGHQFLKLLNKLCFVQSGIIYSRKLLNLLLWLLIGWSLGPRLFFLLISRLLNHRFRLRLGLSDWLRLCDWLRLRSRCNFLNNRLDNRLRFCDRSDLLNYGLGLRYGLRLLLDNRLGLLDRLRLWCRLFLLLHDRLGVLN